MNANTFITVYTVTDANKAELIKVELQNEGMPCRLDGENQAGFSQVFQIGIMVLAKDADRAWKFIVQHEEPDVTGNVPLHRVRQSRQWSKSD